MYRRRRYRPWLHFWVCAFPCVVFAKRSAGGGSAKARCRMFLLLFVQLNEQKNNKMQTFRWVLLYCCLQEGQGRAPLSGCLPTGLKGSAEPGTWSRTGLFGC